MFFFLPREGRLRFYVGTDGTALVGRFVCFAVFDDQGEDTALHTAVKAGEEGMLRMLLVATRRSVGTLIDRWLVGW